MAFEPKPSMGQELRGVDRWSLSHVNTAPMFEFKVWSVGFCLYFFSWEASGLLPCDVWDVRRRVFETLCLHSRKHRAALTILLRLVCHVPLSGFSLHRLCCLQIERRTHYGAANCSSHHRWIFPLFNLFPYITPYLHITDMCTFRRPCHSWPQGKNYWVLIEIAAFPRWAGSHLQQSSISLMNSILFVKCT